MMGAYDYESEKSAPMGPNVKRLICFRMASQSIPNGGGMADGIAFLANKELFTEGARQAEEWVRIAILMVRTAADPNPFRNSTDEEIAGEVIRGIEARAYLSRIDAEKAGSDGEKENT